MTLEIPAIKGQKNLSGFVMGDQFRKKFNISQYDDFEGTVFVHFSPRFVSMNYDFFVGMFGESIKKLQSKFHLRYQFQVGNKMKLRTSEFVEKFVDNGYKRR
jgi:hypothetical protein